MTFRKTVSLLAALGLFSFSGCAAHYQDLLRDRDAEIRDLEALLAESRASSEDLHRREQTAQLRISELLARPAVVEASADSSSDVGIAARLQEELGSDTQVRYESGRLSIGIENTVTFTSGSADVKSSAGTVLQRVADVLRRDFSSRRIYVEGHTDSDPILKTKGRYRNNRDLSLERADAVARYLIKNCGVDETVVAVTGYGQFSPRVQGSDDAAKAKNRRVEIVVGEPI